MLGYKEKVVQGSLIKIQNTINFTSFLSPFLGELRKCFCFVKFHLVAKIDPNFSQQKKEMYLGAQGKLIRPKRIKQPSLRMGKDQRQSLDLSNRNSISLF